MIGESKNKLFGHLRNILGPRLLSRIFYRGLQLNHNLLESYETLRTERHKLSATDTQEILIIKLILSAPGP